MLFASQVLKWILIVPGIVDNFKLSVFWNTSINTTEKSDIAEQVPSQDFIEYSKKVSVCYLLIRY